MAKREGTSSACAGIREARTRLGLTMEQAAGMLGVAYRTWSRWEREAPPTDESNAGRLREFLARSEHPDRERLTEQHQQLQKLRAIERVGCLRREREGWVGPPLQSKLLQLRFVALSGQVQPLIDLGLAERFEEEGHELLRVSTVGKQWLRALEEAEESAARTDWWLQGEESPSDA